MPKRKYDDIISDEKTWTSHEPTRTSAIQNSLDSEEEDEEANEDNYNVMDENDIEGAEDGPATSETSTGFTAFNMKEELEEGHFDKDGHYLWNKEKKIRDNWLDNIDWIKINPDAKKAVGIKDKGLGDSDSESEEESNIAFDATDLYKKILEYLKPGETVSKALCRLGKEKKPISSAERWKRKKAGLAETDENSEKIMKLTELANELLTRTGNMDIYQENYELINGKVRASEKKSHPSELDMYADDFDVKEQKKLLDDKSNPISDSSLSSIYDKDKDETSRGDTNKTIENSSNNIVTWELKWSDKDDAEISGPHTSEQMHRWASEGYFKNSAWVRRTGQSGQFYNASRIDFEIYI